VEHLDDAGLYTTDISRQPLPDRESKTTVVDYLRQAAACADQSSDDFYREYLSELADVLDDLPCTGSDLERVQRVWELLRTHGRNVWEGVRRMRDRYDDPLSDLPPDSLLGLVAARDHLRSPVLLLADAITQIVIHAIGILFEAEGPKNERDLNATLAGLISSHVDLLSEHPTVSFACARVIPDHQVANTDLLIEAKYIRPNTPPSKATEGMAADLTKYPQRAHILFLVYDPSRMLADDTAFRRDFEAQGRCTVVVLR
jgi:hypothetical protein